MTAYVFGQLYVRQGSCATVWLPHGLAGLRRGSGDLLGADQLGEDLRHDVLGGRRARWRRASVFRTRRSATMEITTQELKRCDVVINIGEIFLARRVNKLFPAIAIKLLKFEYVEGKSDKMITIEYAIQRK